MQTFAEIFMPTHQKNEGKTFPIVKIGCQYNKEELSASPAPITAGELQKAEACPRRCYHVLWEKLYFQAFFDAH